MTKTEILRIAEELLTNERRALHGNPSDSFGCICAMWDAYLTTLSRPLEPHDVAALMVLLKASRLVFSPRHSDTWIDIAGYAALGGELAEHFKHVNLGAE